MRLKIGGKSRKGVSGNINRLRASIGDHMQSVIYRVHAGAGFDKHINKRIQMPLICALDQQVAAGADREAVIAGITSRIPIREIPPEVDCARAVLMFLSDYARVVSGASVDVNGGEYMAP